VSLKDFLDNLVEKYETKDFIKSDPIQFPHLFEREADREISAFVSALLSYGRRDKLIENIQKVHSIMDFKPEEFVLNFDYKKDAGIFEGLKYRFNCGNDYLLLFLMLKETLSEYGSLKNLFLQSYNNADGQISSAMSGFIGEMRKFLPTESENEFCLNGINYLITAPEKGGACKRLNMFLRWMVRSGPVDFGFWNEISPSRLIIPLDTHVAKSARMLKLTVRKSDDCKTAFEITNALKEFDPKDPVKYDFALFGMGIEKLSENFS
jgi:uncharacterized protein (TIGR02757 family)